MSVKRLVSPRSTTVRLIRPRAVRERRRRPAFRTAVESETPYTSEQRAGGPRTRAPRVDRGSDGQTARMSDPDLAPGDEAPADREGVGPNVCPDCGGSGRRDDEECPTCAGSGEV